MKWIAGTGAFVMHNMLRKAGCMLCVPASGERRTYSTYQKPEKETGLKPVPDGYLM